NLLLQGEGTRSHKKKLKTRYLIPNTKNRYALLFFATLILLLAPIAFFTLNKPNSADAGWFDDAFGYRQKINISNSSGAEQTDFQVQVELDTQTLISASKLQSDCDDLRFTAQNGEVLPYWLEP